MITWWMHEAMEMGREAASRNKGRSTIIVNRKALATELGLSGREHKDELDYACELWTAGFNDTGDGNGNQRQDS